MLRKPGRAGIASAAAAASRRRRRRQPASARAGSAMTCATARASAVLAPLTGLFYSRHRPARKPYVRVGSDMVVGQVIGLIEAMKLFNEIKSDRAGRVVRICVEDGALVKAKQPLIEVEP